MTQIRAAALLLLVACASQGTEIPTRAASASDDSAPDEVIAATERLLAALGDRDTSALRRLVDPSVRFFAIPADDTDPDIRVFDLEEFLGIVAQSAEPLAERIWNPHVLVDGPLASLWAPYDFHVGGRFSHCGHAAFQYVLREQTWWLVSETYTVRVESCPGEGRSRG
jgi:hypothetical protein